MRYDNEYFKGKTALITGGASGIGLALAEELLKSDASRVAIADINGEKLPVEEKRLNDAYGNRVIGILCDVTIENEVGSMVAQAVDFFGGRLDLLFNNAGKAYCGPFEEFTNEDWERAFALNYYAAVYGMRAALQIMKRQGGGQIVNIISGAAFSPMAYWAPYSVTKAALNALSLVLRSEYWDDNIKISSATPGTTRTAIWDQLGGVPPAAQTPEQSAQRMLHGVARNDRMIFGDDPDLKGAKHCFDQRRQEGLDAYYLDVARKRAGGDSTAY